MKAILIRFLQRVTGRCVRHAIATMILPRGLRANLWMLPALLGVFIGLPVRGQAPGLLWSNNVGARLFAVDAQSNVYASTNGTVIKMNSAGVPLQTTPICPLPGIAQRDSAGNFYFLGNFDGTQNFGGITLVGGWTNWLYSGKRTWQAGWPTCYLAKYGSAGSLQWVISFGLQAYNNRADDLAVNPDGSVVVGYDVSGMETLAQFSANGTNIWQSLVLGSPLGSCAGLKVSALAGTNGAFVRYNIDHSLAGGFYDTAGILTWGTGGPIGWQDPLSLNATPVRGTSNEIYAAGLSLPSLQQPFLTKWKAQALQSSQTLGSVEQWLLAGDGGGNLYLAGADGIFSKYDGAGNLLWSTNYGPPAIAMQLDSQGNGLISFTNGAIARLEGTSPPQLSMKSSGSALVFSWPSKNTNYALFASTNMSVGWTSVSNPPVLIGDQCVVTNPFSGSSGFFRLQLK